MTYQVFPSVFNDQPPKAVQDQCGLQRDAKLKAMKLSLTETFGERALLIAQGQPNDKDVGWNSGVRWHEVCAVLSCDSKS